MLASSALLFAGGKRTTQRAIDVSRPYREQLRTEEDPAVLLLLCAADLAERGAPFPLSAACEALGIPVGIDAITAALSLRDVGALYGADWNVSTYLEAAYRLMESA